MNHKIKLTNAAAMLLRSALSNIKPGWVQSLQDLAVASTLLTSTFRNFKPKFSASDGGAESDLDEAWATREVEWQFSERERESCKSCLTTLVKILPPGAPALELITKFGLKAE